MPITWPQVNGPEAFQIVAQTTEQPQLTKLAHGKTTQAGLWEVSLKAIPSYIKAMHRKEGIHIRVEKE